MHLAHLHQSLPAQYALRIAPIIAQMIWKGAVYRFVIGVANNAALWVHKAWIGFSGHHAAPSVLVKPSLRRDAPLTNHLGIAAGLAANDLQCNIARTIGQGQVLRGRDVTARGANGCIHGLRTHQGKPRLQTCIAGVERRPCQSHDMVFRRDRAQIPMGRRDDRAISAVAQSDGYRRTICDLNDFLARLKGDKLRPRAVKRGIVWIKFFNEEIHIIDIGRGHAPCQTIRPPNGHDGHTRNGRPNHPA